MAFKQLFPATFSIAFPTSLSLVLYVTRFIDGILSTAVIVLRWLWPIPAFRVARAALLFTSKAFGPLLPHLCVLDVNTAFLFPQKGQFTVNVLASPLLVSL